MADIDSQTRKKVATLIEMYLKGKIDLEIEFQKLKLQDEICVDSVNYKHGNSNNDSNKIYSTVENFQPNKARIKYKISKLLKMKKLLNIFFQLIDDDSKKILKLFYKHNLTISQLQERMGYAEISIKKKKRKTLDLLAKRLNLTSNNNIINI